MKIGYRIAYALLIGFVLVAGRWLDYTDTLPMSLKTFVFPLVGYSLIAFAVISVVHIISKTISGGFTRFAERTEPTLYKIRVGKYILPPFMWMIGLFASFPGIFAYDCQEEWVMINEGYLTSHHPVIHVLLLGGITDFSYKKFGNANIGIFIYVVLQLLFFSAVYFYLIYVLRRMKKAELTQWIVALFYAFSPIVELFAISTTKDSIFELWLILLILLMNISEELPTTKYWVAFTFASFGTAVFRKNGLYIVIALGIYLLIKKARIRRHLAISLAVFAATYLIYVGPVYKALNVEPGSVREALSVPIQQLARVHTFAQEDISSEDKEVLYSIIPKEYWRQYIPTVSDPVKAGFVDAEFSRNKFALLRIWAKYGIKHPKLYIDSVLVNTVDLWYPFAVNDGYRGLYQIDTSKSNLFEYRVIEPGSRIVFWSGLNRYFTFLSYDLSVGKKVWSSVLMNSGWYILIWVLSLFIDFSNRNKEKYSMHIAIGVSLLTVLLGPMACIRYVLAIYLVFPVMLMKFDTVLLTKKE